MGRSLLADAIKYVKDCVRYIIRKKRGERGEGGGGPFPFSSACGSCLSKKRRRRGTWSRWWVVRRCRVASAHWKEEEGEEERGKKKGGEQINVKKKGENACEGDAWVTDTRGFQNGFD